MTSIALAHSRGCKDTLEAHPALAGIDEATRRTLIERARSLEWGAGRRLLEEGQLVEGWILITHGSVKLVLLARDGRAASAGLVRAPGGFGPAEALFERRSGAAVVALEKGAGAELPGPLLRELSRRSPSLLSAMLKACQEQEATTLAKLKESLFLPVGVRVARLFLEYARSYGLPVPEGTKIRLRLNQEEIAAELGVARRSVTRALKAWQDDGWLTKAGGYFIVRDRARLLVAAEVEEAPRLYSVGG